MGKGKRGYPGEGRNTLGVTYTLGIAWLLTPYGGLFLLENSLSWVG